MNMIKIKHLPNPERCNHTEESWVNLDHIESIEMRREFIVIKTCCRGYFVDKITWRSVRNIMICKDVKFTEEENEVE